MSYAAPSDLNSDTWLPELWQSSVSAPDQGALLLPAQRHRELVLRAWTELASMNLADGLATIAAIEAACAPAPLASIDVQCALLQAVSMALKDNAEGAGE